MNSDSAERSGHDSHPGVRPARVLGPDHARRVPWKNGKGTTLEVASDATPGGPWTWRLSIACVPQRTAFSAFPGVDRAIACLTGDGMRLLRGGVWHDVPRSDLALEFPGEDAVEGEPSGPGVRDANLMARRDSWRLAMRLVRGGRYDAEASIIVVHAPHDMRPAAASCGGRFTALSPGATLVAGGAVAIEPTGDSPVIVALLWPRAGGSA